MTKTFFENLASKENGEFIFKKNILKIGLGVRSPQEIYQLNFKYLGAEIQIKYSLGTSFSGSIICLFFNNIEVPEFEISSTSNFIRLFLKKKEGFNIASTNEEIKRFFNQNSALKKLTKISFKENFTPLIISKENRITTEFHLEFKDSTQVIEPVIQLYKNLINKFNEMKAH